MNQPQTAARTSGTTSATQAGVIADDTRMDAVSLHVRDLDTMIDFYTRAVSLEILEHPAGAGSESAAADRREGVVTLGRGSTPLVVLQHTPDLPARRPGSAGLFHTAVLYDSHAALAATLRDVARHAPQQFTGSADHLVSEAFYLDDPEGNGVELYVDRPRDQWDYDGNQVGMASLPLDPDAFLREHLTGDERAADDAVVGHVHLQVGDIPSARAFYVDTLGFAPMASMPSALFVSAGGYHHHLAVNTWASQGTGPRAVALGLGEVSIVLPTHDDVAALSDRLTHHRVASVHDGAALRFDDPWRNRISVSVEP